MIKLKEIYNAWGYSEKVLKKSEDLFDVITTLVIDCRQYYGIIGMDFPRYEISTDDKILVLDCGTEFYNLNTDEKVIEYVKKWYSSLKV